MTVSARPSEPAGEAERALRRGVLAVSVLHDIDLLPTDDGVRLTGADELLVSWSELALAVADADPESARGRLRLREWLHLRALGGELGPLLALRAEQCAVPLGLTADHVGHPGPGWEREIVAGGLIRLGVGLRGMYDGPEEVVALPDPLAEILGIDTGSWWPALRLRLEDMGRLTVARLRRDGFGLMSPMGGCDVVTLLGAASLREHLATSDGTGLRAIAVPVRSRGWFDLARIDPAFVAAAYAATDESARGLPRPALVTIDEVTLARPGGDVLDLTLRDPAISRTAWSS